MIFTKPNLKQASMQNKQILGSIPQYLFTELFITQQTTANQIPGKSWPQLEIKLTLLSTVQSQFQGCQSACKHIDQLPDHHLHPQPTQSFRFIHIQGIKKQISICINKLTKESDQFSFLVKFHDVWRRKFWKKISNANSTNFDFLKN